MTDSLMLSFNLCKGRLKLSDGLCFYSARLLRISDISVSGMVVYRFEVFAFNNKRFNAFVGNQRSGYIANHIFDKLRIFVCFFRYLLLVRAFEQTVELAACLRFDVIDNFFNAYIRVCYQADGYMRTLVVRAVLGNFFGTRTQ